MENKTNVASDIENDVNGDRRMTRSASGRGRRGAHQVVIQRNRPTTTAVDKQPTINPPQQQLEVTTDEDVARSPAPQPISLVNRVKRRTMWTPNKNQFLVRCYYRTTKLETSKQPYGTELRRLVTERYPELSHKTTQNIIDQRRSIFNNNRLSADTINRIRNEVAVELGMQQQDDPIVNREQNNEEQAQELITEPTGTENEFETNMLKYNGIVPHLRPKLPKLIYKMNTENTIREVDAIIATKIKMETNIEELHTLIYIGAITVLQLNEQTVVTTEKRKEHRTHKPPWERRLENKIKFLRKDIGILTEAQRPQPSEKVKRITQKLIRQHKTKDNPTATEILDNLKQKLAATSKRLRRYTKSNLRKRQNHMFSTNERIFYRTLEQNTTPKDQQNEELPSAESIKEFWTGIWNRPVTHKKARWLQNEKLTTNNVHTMLEWKINKTDIQNAVRKTHNWKAPGPDHIQNFWIKKFAATHEQLATCFTKIIEQPDNMPDFMTRGITVLLPKGQYCAEPSKYRPITCLPTTYKLLTAIIAVKVYNHLDANALLDEEQKGCRKGSQGCKEQLTIDSIITNTAKQKQKALYTAYIDYQKAFDSIPHSWLKEVLHIYKINEHIIAFLTHAMSTWKTNLRLNTPSNQINAGIVQIQRGIFQGDALSPLWFCMALRPLTSFLNSQKKGYSIDREIQISHLWYMDDLKLYSSKKEHLQKLLECVGKFSSDVGMKFGLDKCKISCMEKGKWTYHEGYEVNKWQGKITSMQEGEKYKYLGYLQTQGIDQKEAKKVATDTYIHRLRTILKTELSARNTTHAINTYATSVLTYTHGILKWTDTELNALDIKTRKEFKRTRAHHPHSSVERFHLGRNQGGRGIASIPEKHHKETQRLRTYFIEKATTSSLHRAIGKLDKMITPLRLADPNYNPEQKIKSEAQIKEQWKSKPLHGKYLAAIENDTIDTAASQHWLKAGELFIETEGAVAAIQDQVIYTKSYRKRIVKENIQNIKCRMCNSHEETTDHITAGCTTLAPKLYLDRHNRVAKILYLELMRKYTDKTGMEPYYAYEPPPVYEDDTCKLYWNRKIITDRPIPNNIPDIVLTLKAERTTYIIDIAVPLVKNIEKTNTEKVNKYIPLADEIKDMWQMQKVIILPIIIGTLGEVPKKLTENIGKLMLNTNIYKIMQKSVLLDTSAIVRRVLGQDEIGIANN